MPLTANDIIAAVGDHLPEGMLPPATYRALRRAAKAFHSYCSSFYLEWHLATPARIDLLCSVVQEHHRQLLDRVIGHDLMATDARWETLRRFLYSWDRINDDLDGRIPHIWLACDYDTASNRFDPPNIHLCLDREFLGRSDNPEYRNVLTKHQFGAVLDAMKKNGIQSPPPKTIRALRKFFSALANGGEVLHISFMHSRTEPVFKLNCMVPKANLTGLLVSTQPNIDTAIVNELVNDFAPDSDRIKCNLCVGSAQRNQFELELEYNTPLDTDPRRKRMLTSLRKRGLITIQQARSLKKWPGRTTAPSPRGGNAPHHFERWLDVKIVIKENCPVFAKAYLGFSIVPKINW